MADPTHSQSLDLQTPKRAPRFDAILFDLDGTLIDSAPDIHAGANAALAKRGLPQITADQARAYVGHGAAIFIERLRNGLGLGPDLQDPLLADFLAIYETAVSLTELYDGVESTLQRLAHNGFALGLVTNKPIGPTRNVVAHFDWQSQFGVVLGGDSLPVRKPDPAPLQAAIETLGCKAPLYVGDSEVDAETAARAGVPFALFTRGYRKAPIAELPHLHAFDSYDAFTDWLIG